MSCQQGHIGTLFLCIPTQDLIPVGHPLCQMRRLADRALDQLNHTFCLLSVCPCPRATGTRSHPTSVLLALCAASDLWHLLRADVDREDGLNLIRIANLIRAQSQKAAMA